MNTKSALGKKLPLIPLVLAVLALIFFYFGVFVWLVMTLGLLMISFGLPETGNYDSERPYYFMGVALSCILLECGFTPTLLNGYCNEQEIAWIGAIASLVMIGTFFFTLKTFWLQEWFFGVIFLCIILFWHYYPSVWEIYFWISIVIIAFVLIFYFQAIGAELRFICKNRFKLSKLLEPLFFFLVLETVVMFIAILLLGWNWIVFGGALALGCIAISWGFINDDVQ